LLQQTQIWDLTQRVQFSFTQRRRFGRSMNDSGVSVHSQRQNLFLHDFGSRWPRSKSLSFITD
jgi:hypothetical protein